MGATAQKLKEKRKNRLPPFVPLFNNEQDSVAWRELTPSASKCYLDFKRIAGRVAGKMRTTPDTVTFDFTYSEAKQLGYAKKTFSRIISTLIAKGFIVIMKQGGKRGDCLSNTKFMLSDRWKNYGKYGFIEIPRYPSEP